MTMQWWPNTKSEISASIREDVNLHLQIYQFCQINTKVTRKRKIKHYQVHFSKAISFHVKLFFSWSNVSKPKILTYNLPSPSFTKAEFIPWHFFFKLAVNTPPSSIVQEPNTPHTQVTKREILSEFEYR